MKKRQRKKNGKKYDPSFWDVEFKLIDKITGESKSFFNEERSADELGRLMMLVNEEVHKNPNYEIWFR